ncbi:acidic leucine-rich nuclear phosphoprotein 32 family member B-like [Gossypium australe]|uniref:Acidic leucine-rich nuclear phosphoprotein 32 family member B-like n=1 Tax=Gossypium australe TaxID=47621 RepID=A0A5B6VVV5_9ROSI|nr:acidic leucine-rich nuclear phosphoprotein 32 family member B-like [Gossypium australe]
MPGLDEAVVGTLMNRTYEDVYEIIENMALNSFQWLIERFTNGQKPAMKPQDRANLSDHIACGQPLDRIEGEMQSMRTDVKQVQSECINSTRTLTKLKDQMSQLMSMMGDIKRQIGIGIPSNTEDNPRREGKEHVKTIALRSSKVLSSLENPTLEVIIKNIDDPQEVSPEAKDEPMREELMTLTAELERETPQDAKITKIPFPSRLEEKKMGWG